MLKPIYPSGNCANYSANTVVSSPSQSLSMAKKSTTRNPSGQKPADLESEDYKKFFEELYPAQEAPLFSIHINTDYPFNLTGVLYFPKVNEAIDNRQNRVQLYCNQVFVTEDVKDVLPEYLVLLKGVIDSRTFL